MNIYLGQQQEDGVIRYITSPAECNATRNFAFMLKTFYSKVERVTALIDLGNLYQIGQTPYGKHKDYFDKVHCGSEIRDEKKGKGPRLPKYADSETEYAKLDGHLLLFKEGHWYYFDKGQWSADLPFHLSSKKEKPLEGLEVFKLNPQNNIQREYSHSAPDWASLKAKSAEEHVPYFVFRGDKLVTTINHPLNK